MNTEKLYKVYWKHYNSKIITYKEKEKVEFLTLLASIMAAAIFLLLSGISSYPLNLFFTILSALTFIVSFSFYSKLKMTRENRIKQEDLLIESRNLIQYANERETAKDYDSAIEIWEELGQIKQAARVLKNKAKEREHAKDYDSATQIWEELGEIDEAARVRTLKSEQGAVKVTQKIVHGDDVTKTEIKDSVLNRSNVGGGSSKADELREAKALLDEGLINEDDYEKMKKEILGK